MDLDLMCDRRQLTRGLGVTLLALGLANSSPGLAAPSLAAASAADDWTELWSLQTDANSLGRPQLVDGVLYVAGSGVIRAVDAASGTELWSVAGSEQFAVDGSVLYTVIHDDGAGVDRLIARDVTIAGETGVWAIELGGPLTYESPLTVTPQGVLLAVVDDHDGANYTVTAFDLADGTVRWRFGGEPEIHPSWRFAYADGAAFIAVEIDDDDEYLVALDAATGDERWSQTLSADDLGGHDVIVAGDLVAYGGVDSISVRDAATGDNIWRARVGSGYVFAEAIAEGRLYAYEHPDTDGDNSILHAIDLTTHEETWASIKIPVRTTENVVPGAEVVFVPYSQKGGGFVVFDAMTGERITRYHANSPVRGLTVAGDTVYLTSVDGIIRALRYHAAVSSDVFPVIDEQTHSSIDVSAATTAISSSEIE